MNKDQLKIIAEAIKIFNSGGVVIFPTDTAFGIGCKIDNEEALKKLLTIKNRPSKQALPVLISDLEMAKKYFMTPLPAPDCVGRQAGLPKKIKKLMIDYWPGGLTIVYKANKTISSLIKGGGENIGLRMPDNEMLLKIIEKIGVPIIGTSANFHDKPTPYTISEIDKRMIKQVDYVISGECNGKLTSTVIDCTQNPWKIIRQGKVKFIVRSASWRRELNNDNFSLRSKNK